MLDTRAADLIALATGYKNQNHLVRELFGDAVADRIGPVWGFGAGQELKLGRAVLQQDQARSPDRNAL
jgi:hypothetical protein